MAAMLAAREVVDMEGRTAIDAKEVLGSVRVA